MLLRDLNHIIPARLAKNKLTVWVVYVDIFQNVVHWKNISTLLELLFRSCCKCVLNVPVTDVDCLFVQYRYGTVNVYVSWILPEAARMCFCDSLRCHFLKEFTSSSSFPELYNAVVLWCVFSRLYVWLDIRLQDVWMTSGFVTTL